MNWTESSILTIATKRLFYFDKEVSSSCARICERLKIDVFPDYDGKSFFKVDSETGKWQKDKISANQKIQARTPLFDNAVIDLFCSAPSQILFVFDDDQFRGIVHFTDYGKKIVYRDLYNNFFEFERNLRKLLIIRRFDADHLIKYFEFKAKKYPKDAEEYNRRKSTIIQERSNYPFDSLFTSDLLEFCYSSFHKISGSVKPLNIGDTEKRSINELRKIVMHNKDNTGMSSVMPHNFEKFKIDFFQLVQVFKKTFAILSKEIESYEILQKPKLNRIWLNNLVELSDKELERLFFDYEKYI